ncbi:MAG: DUF3617 family protein [Rhizomicrobium sp.]
MHRVFLLIFAALLVAPQGASAAGKAGLWTVTTTWQFGMPVVPPAIAALVRQQKLKPPTNGQPFTHYMCMTPSEADGSEPLHFNNRELDCVNRTVSARGARMVLESVCHGPLEGVGRAQIAWRGNQHFDGSYLFKGRLRGDTAQMSSSFSADWSGSDCRGVRPFIPPTP